MRKTSLGLVGSFVLVLVASGCSDGGGGGGKGGTTGAAGRGGTTGAAGRGGTTGAAGTTAAAGTNGAAGTNAAAGTGGGVAGTGGGTAGATAGTGGGAAGRGGTGGGTAGATAGTGGGAAGTGGGVAGTGGGAAGTGGGAAGTGGGMGGSVGGGSANPPITGTATRPQLASGTDYTILKYLEKAGSFASALTTDNWDPTAGVDLTGVTPMFTVAASGGTHTSVQLALNAAVAVGGTARVYIQVNPGTYRETICIKSAVPPITLYGMSADASQTVIVNSANAGKMYVDATTQPAWNTCAATNPPAAGANYGTSGSAATAIFAANFQVKNLTFANDFDEAGGTSNIQAVALMTQADKLVFENVRVLGNQDTLYVKSPNIDTVSRAYFKGCYVEGDVDFIFGRAAFVLDTCEIKYLGARRGATNGGDIISPSTDFRNTYGLLIINSMFTSDGVPNAGTVALGRAWDEGQATATYPLPSASGGYPNGQAVVRNSMLGAHLTVATPWSAAATTSRAYSSVASGAIPANRLWEFMNTGPGAAP